MADSHNGDQLRVEFVVGWDERERLGWNVCVRSIYKHSKLPPIVRPISIPHLGSLYKRQTERRNGRWWDFVSGAYCSTQFSIARFWAPWDATTQWTVFMDGDFLIRDDLEDLTEQLDPQYGLMCVKHQYEPTETEKMDGQVQTTYPRKGWSSLMAFNNRHEATRRLLRGNVVSLNDSPGLELQQLKWLEDSEIGALDPAWNWLEGTQEIPSPKAVHFTRGTPDMITDPKYAREWWEYANGP